MSLTLEDRFNSFLRKTASSEEIDSLKLSGEYQKSKKADYLLCNRRLIIELKTLKSDTSHKVSKEMEKHQDRGDYPLFYGSQSLKQILSHLPDGVEINNRIYRNITRSIEDIVSKADKQIKSTRDTFNLNDTVGLLVVLNESIEILTPEVVGRRLSELLCKKDPDNSFHYKNIQYVWLIAESHYCDVEVGSQGLISACIVGPSTKEDSWFENEFDKLQSGWAEFNHVPLIRSKETQLSNMSFKSTAVPKEKNEKPRSNSDLWRLQYNCNPYLRPLSDNAIYAFGQQLLEEMIPNFLINGQRLPQDKMKALIVSWTEFLEEANFRGLDLKKIRATRFERK